MEDSFTSHSMTPRKEPLKSDPAPKTRSSLEYFRIATHSLIFWIQGVVYTLPNAIYFEIFQLVGILGPNDQEETPRLVGYCTGAFFAGKLVSDPIWGLIRDNLGDKITISLITALLFTSLILVEFSKGFWTLISVLVFIGFNSGLMVPGLAFMNWIDPKNRDTLSVWVYGMSGAGALSGPFIGGFLIKYLPQPKLLYTFGGIGALMIFITVIFLIAFRSFNDRSLIVASDYNELDLMERQSELDSIVEEQEKIEKETLSQRKQKKSLTDKVHRLKIDDLPKAGNKINLKPKHEMEIMASRRRVSQFSATELFRRDRARRYMICLNAISWMVKLIDWILFALFVQMDPKIGGFGLNSIETGAINVLSFPGVALLVLILFNLSRESKSTTWLNWMSIVYFVIMVFIPMLRSLVPSHEGRLMVVIFLIAIKEASYLLWVSSWSTLISKLIPKIMLGRVYSMSFFFGHVMLAVASQLFPPLLSFMIKNSFLKEKLGYFTISTFFIILGLPLLLNNYLTRLVRIDVLREDNLKI